ncbi:hypothetical protein R0G64_29850 [Pseudomonas otitidis]|uniref:Uncharacterized protein n=1 Tax=Metapseudomonas otitidis TaxID=319939 RepID=A0ABU3Y0F9_9GAMM|nr:hypothetical protein [Pseudomonas otitidis]MDV3443623.1 hypothetical protein [Pseudomonas otitidis]
MSDVKRWILKNGKDHNEYVLAADYDALAAAHEQAWKSASSESHAWAREFEARMRVVAERDQLRAERDSHQRLCIAEMEKSAQLRAELEAIRGKGVLYVSAESLADDGVVGMHATRKPNAVQNVALYAIPPQQPDAWPTLDKPAKVGPARFNPGLSARLVVEAAQRQHEYSQQPEVEAARLERFGAFMQEVHGEQPDAVNVPGVHEFAVEILRGALEGGNFDGGDIQEMGVRHGLLFPEQRTEPCCESGCNCAEFGFPAECFRIARALLSTKNAEEV